MARTVPLMLPLGLALVGCTPPPRDVSCAEVPVVDPAPRRPPVGGPVSLETFLPLLPDRDLRLELWAFYRKTEPLARRLAPEWTEVRLVIASDRSLWWTHGLIELPVAKNDQGALAHELFHGAYHRSALNAGEDAAWGEGFADAFRYLIEVRLLGADPSPWRREMDRLKALTPEERRAARDADETIRVYSYPALLILERAQWDLARFEALWRDLDAKRAAAGRDILHEVFGDALAQPLPPEPD